MDKEQLKRLHRVHRPENFRPRASTWYEIRNVSTDVAVVHLYDEIGLWGVTASSFIEDLHSVNAKRIELHVSSPGGDVFDGLAIMNSLTQHPAEVHVIVDGLAASAASFIAMAGDKIEVAPGSMFMIHEASGICGGSAADMLEMAALLDKASANIANIYARRSGGDAETWRNRMRAETWYLDQEAVDAGLADGILGEAPDTEECPPGEDGHPMEPDEEKRKKTLQPAASSSTRVTASADGPQPEGEDITAKEDTTAPTVSERIVSLDLASVIGNALTAAKEANRNG